MNFREYALPATLEEAWQLNQKRSNRILGGTLWMRMGSYSFHTAIDLSALPLHDIEETDGEFRIGCMVSLHALETHASLNELCGGALREALRGIVGVQFRNGATVGGSLFGRFGFSDVLTVFMAMNAEVELYKAGRMSVEAFAAKSHGNDILTHVIVPKRPMSVVYLSQRNTKTDFPVLTCAVSQIDGQLSACIGARPMRAVRFVCEPNMSVADFAAHIQKNAVFGGNLRASAEYRRHIAGVLVRRGCEQIGRCDHEA